MLIHPWDAARDDREWRDWLAGHDFGQLAVNGPEGEPPFVQPTHFAYRADRGELGEVVLHLARPNPIWPAVTANPRVLLSVVDDDVYVPGPWQATDEVPPEHGVPTSFYATVQLGCVAQLVDEPEEKAALLRDQLAHFQPAGDHGPVAPDQAPYGRMLPGIRGLRLEVTEVRAKFKYGSQKPVEVRRRTAEGLARRNGPRDAAALAHHRRRGAAADRAEPGAAPGPRD